MESDEREIRAFLLGTLTEVDAAALEARLLEDDGFFDEVSAVEADLLDDAARGRLGVDDMRRFEARYAADDERHGFARSLKRSVTIRKTKPPFRSNRGWLGGLALAASLILGIGLLRQTRTDPPRAAPPVVVPSVAPASVASVTFDLRTERSTDRVPRLEIGPNVSTVRVELRLDPRDDFAAYSVEMKSPAEEVIFTESELRGTRDGDVRRLAFALPASRLDIGLHQISVNGLGDGVAPEPVGFVSIRVTRSR
jgi:hypothetical protein